MQIGFNLPNSGPLSPVATMTRIATEGEAMGFDYLTMTDHVVLPDTKVPGYPYSESGEFYEAEPTERHEQLIAMAYVAAKTSRIRLVAAVLVVPHRPAVLAAKMLAGEPLTIGEFAAGRDVAGTPSECIEQVRTFEQLTSCEYFLAMFGETPTVEVLSAAIELFGREVIPAFA